jgi:methylated-DNA-protein-cysteine methyltransferase-like protein
VPGESGFFLAVYRAVRAIPRGHVTTYGALARRLGVPRGARAVGWALRALGRTRRAPVPWHRVVGSGGRISPRDGSGMAEQRRRLLREGVRFRGGRVDMRRHALTLQPVATRGSAKRARARRFM